MLCAEFSGIDTKNAIKNSNDIAHVKNSSLTSKLLVKLTQIRAFSTLSCERNTY